MGNMLFKMTSNSPTLITDELLYDDIILEILRRLPCKSAVRCKTVSKHWFSLLSSPAFLHKYLNLQHALSQKLHGHHHDQNSYQECWFYSNACLAHAAMFIPKQLALEVGSSQRDFSLSFLGLDQVQIHGYSNGLLLCNKHEHSPAIFYICNPLTKEWIQLPPAPSSPVDSSFVYAGFICEPYYKIEETVVALNWHPRFWVVRIVTFRGTSFGFNASIFSSENGLWIQTVVSCSRGFNCITSNPFCFTHNGRLHFRGRHNFLVFDPCNNSKPFYPIDYPKPMGVAGMLGVSCGTLRFSISSSHVNSRTSVAIWELENYDCETDKGTWCLLHKDSLEQAIWESSGVPFRSYVKPLAWHPHDANVIYYGVVPRPPYRTFALLGCNLVLSYNLQTKSLVKVGEGKARLILPMVLPLWPTPIPLLEN